MKTNQICINLYSASYNAKNVENLCGHYKADFDTQQNATYSIENGIATIHSLTGTYGTVVNLPLPFLIPVNDLGSGILRRVEINVDTFRAHQAICPKTDWVERRMQQPAPTIQQTLLADYIGL